MGLSTTYTKVETDYKLQELQKLLLSGIKGELAISDAAPTTQGLYILSDIGTYTNLGGIVTTTDKLNYAYFDGTTWSLVEVAFPQNTAKIETWSAKSYTQGSQVIKDGNIYEAKEATIANEIPGISLKWAVVFSSGDWDKINTINKYFLQEEYIKDEIILPNSSSVDGKFLTYSINEYPVASAEYGIISMNELAGYESITIEGDMWSLGNCSYLIVKTKEGQFNVLAGKTNKNKVTIEIDHTAQNYIYSRLKGATFFFKSKNTGTLKEDAIKKYIDEINKTSKKEGLFYPEDYGAEIINPRDPDNSKDSTTAFNEMFEDMFNNYDHLSSYKVIMSGIYRIGGTPVNGSQIAIPFKSLDYNWKSITLEGVFGIEPLSGAGESGSTNRVPLVGCGFYCSYIHTTDSYKSVIHISPGTHFGQKIGHIHLDNIAVFVKTHDVNYNSVVNRMCGLTFNNLSSASFSNLFISHTIIDKSKDPSLYSIGLYMPSVNNMASVYGNSLKTQGFGIGSILTEHMNLNHLCGIFHKKGVIIEKTYPVNIGSVNLEHNAIHMEITPDGAVNIGCMQTEDGLAVAGDYYYGGHQNHITGSSSSIVTIGNIKNHVWGGGKIPFAYSNSIKLRYLMDEYGNSKLT